MPFDVKDLARLLRGAHITINLQTGQQATQYIAQQMQVNQHAAPPKPRYTCRTCGYASNTRSEFNTDLFGGAECWPCVHGKLAAKRAREAVRFPTIVLPDDEADDEAPPAPALAAAPDAIETPPPTFAQRRADYWRAVEERYAGEYEELQRARAAHIEAEFARLKHK